MKIPLFSQEKIEDPANLLEVHVTAAASESNKLPFCMDLFLIVFTQHKNNTQKNLKKFQKQKF
jgi:hypothetical protein